MVNCLASDSTLRIARLNFIRNVLLMFLLYRVCVDVHMCARSRPQFTLAFSLSFSLRYFSVAIFEISNSWRRSISLSYLRFPFWYTERLAGKKWRYVVSRAKHVFIIKHNDIHPLLLLHLLHTIWSRSYLETSRGGEHLSTERRWEARLFEKKKTCRTHGTSLSLISSCMNSRSIRKIALRSR